MLGPLYIRRLDLVHGLGPSIVYFSGRRLAPGEEQSRSGVGKFDVSRQPLDRNCCHLRLYGASEESQENALGGESYQIVCFGLIC